jgi:hypothetical protein
MPDQWEEIRLTHHDDDYALERRDATGALSTISLSGSNLLSLLPLIQKECAQLKANLLTPGLKAQGVLPNASMEVRRFLIANDLHKSEIYLSLVDNDENAYSFSFRPPESAKRVGLRLIERADQLAASSPATKQ